MKGLVGASVMVAVAWCTASGCERQSMPVSPAPSTATPVVQGIVRGVNGGPLSGALVKYQPNHDFTRLQPVATTNAAGEFTFKASAGCQGGLWVVADLVGFREGSVSVNSCSTGVVAANIMLVRALTLNLQSSSAASLQTVLSADNPDYANVYDCGSCQPIDLVPGLEPIQVTIAWSTNDRLSAWVEGFEPGWQDDGLGQFQSAQGQNTITFTVPPEWSRYTPLTLLIGLPVPSGGRLQSAVQVGVSVQRPSHAP